MWQIQVDDKGVRYLNQLLHGPVDFCGANSNPVSVQGRIGTAENEAAAALVDAKEVPVPPDLLPSSSAQKYTGIEGIGSTPMTTPMAIHADLARGAAMFRARVLVLRFLTGRGRKAWSGSRDGFDLAP